MYNHFLVALSCLPTHLQLGWCVVKNLYPFFRLVVLLKEGRDILTTRQPRWRCVGKHENATIEMILHLYVLDAGE